MESPARREASVEEHGATTAAPKKKMSLQERTIDAVMYRKTRYGAWKERYFRTERHMLYYYSNQVAEIKANRLSSTVVGPYRYKAVGSPSEAIDLRASGSRVELGSSTPGSFVLSHGEHGKTLEIRAESAEEASRWVKVLSSIITNERREMKIIGRLSVSIEGGYFIGEYANDYSGHPLECTLSYGGQSHVTPPTRLTALDKEVLYENVDESEEPVWRFENLAIEAVFPVTQARTALTFAIERPPAKRSEAARLRNLPPNPPVVLASRAFSLFELQYDNAINNIGNQPLRSESEVVSALEGDISRTWPAAAPDGTRPSKPGYRWLTVFEPQKAQHPEMQTSASSIAADMGKLILEHRKQPRLRAMILAKVEYDESIVAVIDPEAHARYEASDDYEEFKLELLSSGTTRLNNVYEEVDRVVVMLFGLFEWRQPLKSALAWLVLVGSVLSLPDHSSLAIFPLFTLFGLLAALPRLLSGRLHREFLTGYDDDVNEGGGAPCSTKRNMAEVCVTVLAARNLDNGADSTLSRKKKKVSTDPYAVVINVPPPPCSLFSRRVSPMLIGTSTVKFRTLSPQWISTETKPPAVDHNKSLEEYASSTYEYLSAQAHSNASIVYASPSAIGGPNASELSRASVRLFGDGDCVRPPVDFRTKEAPENGFCQPEASWTYPLLQELESQQLAPTLRPWTVSEGRVMVEIFDSDLTETDDFLGRAFVDLGGIFKEHATDRNAVYEAWLPLKPRQKSESLREVASYTERQFPATVNLKKRLAAMTVRQSVEKVVGEEARKDLGEVLVSVRVRHRQTDDQGRWVYEQEVSTQMLEQFEALETTKKVGYVGQYKNVTRSMKYMQDNALCAATLLERVVALCTWIHPKKTALVCAGLLASIVAACLVPNKYLVAAMICKMFVKGAAIRLRGQDESCIKAVDPTETQFLNLLSSLPCVPTLNEAFATKRLIFAAQHQRDQLRIRVNLHFAFRVRAQLKAWLFDDGGTVVGSLRPWSMAYVVIANGLIVVWPSLQHAAENKKPLANFQLAGSAEIANSPTEEAVSPTRRIAPPKALGVLSVAARLEHSKKIRDVFFAVKPELIPEFQRAVEAGLDELDRHMCREEPPHRHWLKKLVSKKQTDKTK